MLQCPACGYLFDPGDSGDGEFHCPVVGCGYVLTESNEQHRCITLRGSEPSDGLWTGHPMGDGLRPGDSLLLDDNEAVVCIMEDGSSISILKPGIWTLGYGEHPLACAPGMRTQIIRRYRLRGLPASCSLNEWVPVNGGTLVRCSLQLTYSITDAEALDREYGNLSPEDALTVLRDKLQRAVAAAVINALRVCRT